MSTLNDDSSQSLDYISAPTLLFHHHALILTINKSKLPLQSEFPFYSGCLFLVFPLILISTIPRTLGIAFYFLAVSDPHFFPSLLSGLESRIYHYRFQQSDNVER